MSRREIQVKVSPDLEQERQERDALLGEKNNLQAEMVSIGETNNRVRKEIEELKKDKERLTSEKSNIVSEIDKINGLKSDKEEEIRSLDKIYQNKKLELEKTLPDVEGILSDLELKKKPILNDIDFLSGNQKELNKNLEEIKKEINIKRGELFSIESSIGLRSGQLGLLNNSIDKKELELKKSNEQVSKNEAIVSGIEKRQIILSKINYDIVEAESKFIERKNEIKKFLEAESSDIKKEIEKNRAINEQEKAFHVSLATKKQELDSREAFIKNQYIRAGLQYN